MITREQWSEAAERGLAKALPGPILQIVASEVRSGVSMLWCCEDERHKAYCVTRVDLNPTEFVIVAFEGTGMLTFGPFFMEAARSRGIPIRAHVTSPIVERLLRRLKLMRTEMVLRYAA